MLRISVLLVAVFFFAGGVGYFIFADFFVGAMPSYFPYHLELGYLIGVLQIAGAIGMLMSKTRLYAAYSLIALSVASLPVNITMAVNASSYPEIPLLLLYLRLPFQITLIAFIWWSVSHERVSKKAIQYTSAIPANSHLETVCREFIGAFNNSLKWKWDDRYNTALAEFGVDSEETVHAILERYLQSIWDNNSIHSAPSSIKTVADEMGGLKPGQMLFTSESIEGTFIYCMLWPWGNQKTISIRISPLYQAQTEEDKQLQIMQVKSWFGIQPAESGWVKIDNGAVSAS